jgi:hypothetical protein
MGRGAMSFLPQQEALSSESDVEQKVLYPLFTTPFPQGLGLSPSSIHTKHNLRRFTIGKGAHKKSYFPDYIIVFGGLPLAIIEAKPPHTDLSEAFDEARMYANELNSIFPHQINPASRIIASDGLTFLVGHADEAQPKYVLNHQEIRPYSEKWAAVQEFMGHTALDAEFKRLSRKLRPRSLRKPRRLVGGPAIQEEEIKHNTFGSVIGADLAHIFNPITREDRARVARHAYVASSRRDRMIEPIDRVVRASIPAESKEQLIDDTGKPTKLIEPFHRSKHLEHQVMFIIGGVGAGKTTFIDRLQEVALPPEVRKKTVWVHINMNFAPVTSQEIYPWIKRELVAGCRAAFPKLDFDALEVMKRVYSVEVRIVRSEGQHILPIELVVRVLVRTSRRFYDGNHSFVKNLFAANPDDVRINYFCRLLIVRWLHRRWSEAGPSGLKGYFPVRDLCTELVRHGVEETATIREIEYLAKGHCIVTEDFKTEKLTPEHLVRLGPAGFVHLDLLNNLNYLAAVAEDTWFPKGDTAEAIADRIKTLDGQFSEETIVRNSRDLLSLLSQERSDALSAGSSMLQGGEYESLTDVSEASSNLDRRSQLNPWLEARDRYKGGSTVQGTIVNLQPYGIFVELEPGVTGLVHVSKLPTGFMRQNRLGVGDKVVARILDIDTVKRRISLRYVRPAEVVEEIKEPEII